MIQKKILKGILAGLIIASFLGYLYLINLPPLMTNENNLHVAIESIPEVTSEFIIERNGNPDKKLFGARIGNCINFFHFDILSKTYERKKAGELVIGHIFCEKNLEEFELEILREVGAPAVYISFEDKLKIAYDSNKEQKLFHWSEDSGAGIIFMIKMDIRYNEGESELIEEIQKGYRTHFFY